MSNERSLRQRLAEDLYIWYIGSSAMINNIKANKKDKKSFYLIKRKSQF